MAKDFGCAIRIDDLSPNSYDYFNEHCGNNDAWNFGDIGGLNFDATHIVETGGTVDGSNDVADNAKT